MSSLFRHFLLRLVNPYLSFVISSFALIFSGIVAFWRFLFPVLPSSTLSSVSFLFSLSYRLLFLSCHQCHYRPLFFPVLSSSFSSSYLLSRPLFLCLVITLWSVTNKNRDVSTGPLARPFARSLAPLTRSLARSLCSLPRSWESEFLMSQIDLVLSHSASPASSFRCSSGS